MPRMPFIGVRISWLILARNSDFTLLEASAASWATRLSSTSCLRRSRSTWLSRNILQRPGELADFVGAFLVGNLRRQIAAGDRRSWCR